MFAANDDMAIGALRAFAEAGLSVPGEVSVVGYDDIPTAAYLSPPLTTVRQDPAAVATRAVAVLIAMIEGRPHPGQPGDLVASLSVRELSTAHPR